MSKMLAISVDSDGFGPSVRYMLGRPLEDSGKLVLVKPVGGDMMGLDELRLAPDCRRVLVTGETGGEPASTGARPWDSTSSTIWL